MALCIRRLLHYIMLSGLRRSKAMNWSLVWGLAPIVTLIVVAFWAIWRGHKLRAHDKSAQAKPTTGVTFLGR
jgi:hypothetical protein